MKTARTWVLIADGARARVLKSDGPGHKLSAVAGMEFRGDHAATHDLMSDRQGRSYSSKGPGRSAIEPRTDPHRELKTSFAHRLSAILAKALEEDSYDRLIIVASPVTLGDLRAALSDHVRAKVAAEVGLDLTKVPNGDVADHLKGVLTS
ncbi:MAG: host attachment protein [Pseudomonadota bacterium]